MGARRAMNFLGFDVRALDVNAFLGASRALFPLAAAAFLLLVLWRRSPRLLFLGVLLANAWAFVITTWPLQRLYALGPSMDRVNNLGLCQVVAAGNPAWETSLPGQLHFEPFWGLLMALLSGFDPGRLERLYVFMPLVALIAYVSALDFGWRRPAAETRPDDAWERALVAFCATLLCSSALDWLWSYRVPWALTFLLKPNHALGLVLLPLVLRSVARARGLAGLLGAGFLLHVMGWAFVIHMGLVAIGLVVFALMSWLARRDERRRDLRDVAVVLAVNLAIVSPYLYMLAVGYVILAARDTAVVPPWSAHVLEVTARAGWLFALGAWGALCLWRRGDRLSRLWSAQVVAAFLAWTACLLLSHVRLARELDEFYYWTRFVTAIAAGVGAWDIARRLWARSGRLLARLRLPAWVCADGRALPAVLLAGALVPASVPYWWDPLRMDPFYADSLEPLPEWMARPLLYLREHSRPSDVIVAEREFAPWVSALAARRVLLSSKLNAPRDFVRRGGVERALARGAEPEYVRLGYDVYGVRYLVATPSLARAYRSGLEAWSARPELRLVALGQDGPQRYLALFEVRPEALPAQASP
jgi:hypothetical protein